MSQLADYRLLGELGCGSLGRVLLVRLQSSRTLRAMKVVERGQVSSAKQLAQLEAEGEVLAAISHPYIVKLYHTIRDAACNYYVRGRRPDGKGRPSGGWSARWRRRLAPPPSPAQSG